MNAKELVEGLLEELNEDDRGAIFQSTKGGQDYLCKPSDIGMVCRAYLASERLAEAALSALTSLKWESDNTSRPFYHEDEIPLLESALAEYDKAKGK